ncbi:MAG: hypothetical protein QOF33_837 [Thermomicrobiales bacterium]|jgi:hypothetical protein|nr:hypothetical protein [Thermomicrobiales bacterium]
MTVSIGEEYNRRTLPESMLVDRDRASIVDASADKEIGMSRRVARELNCRVLSDGAHNRDALLLATEKERLDEDRGCTRT